MIALKILFIILSLSFGIKTVFKISQEESILVALLGMGIFTYILGLINLLEISIYIITALSIISLVYTIIKLKKKEIKLKELLTLPTIIYSITILFIYYIVKDIKFMYYDEFMFWGTNLKEMINNSVLWANSQIDGIHLIYPPFTAIIEYIFCVVNGEFNEGICYFGIITLMFTTLMPLFKKEKYTIKSFFKIILTIIITYIAIVLFMYNITNLSVDCILGVIFAVLMFYAYKVEDKKDYIILTMLLISLTLIKTNGILFSGIVIIQLFFNKIFILVKRKEKNVKNILKELSIVGILLVTIITSYATWKIYYTLNGKQIDDRHDKNYTQNINISEFVNAIIQKEEASNRNKKIVRDFFCQIIQSKIIRRYEYNTTICIFIITNVVFLIYIILSKSKLKKLSNFISINIGFILYMLTNLMVFMFVFQEYQGETLMGFERYTQTYLLAMALNIIYFIGEETDYKRIVLILVMLLLMQNGLNDIMLDPRKNNRINSNEHNMMQKKTRMVIDIVNPIQKVYIIDQKLDYGLEFVKTRYYLSPIKTNLLYEWNIGKSQEGIYYKMSITETELIEKLIQENYDYIYIINIKESFFEDYKNIISEQAKNELQTVLIRDEDDTYQDTKQGVLLKLNTNNKMLETIMEK